MKGWLAPVAALALAACGADEPPFAGRVSAAPEAQRPMRIVSLDYCADQYVLKMVERPRILAVSPDAARPFSYLRARAATMPTVAPRAEDVLLLRPDLVVRSYGGGEGIAGRLAAAGVPVLQLGYADSVQAVRAVTLETARQLGSPARGRALAREIDRRVAALRATVAAEPGSPTLLYTTPGGVTTGPGSLIDELVRLAGYRNAEARAGWRSLPLEELVYDRPDRVAMARFGGDHYPDPWAVTRHPVFRQIAGGNPIALDGAWTACGGWFVLDAAEALAAAR